MYLDELKKILNSDDILLDEPMSKHTTFKIGGNAELFLKPKSIEELVKILEIIKKENIKYYVVGKGSNLLVNDDGFDGIIINIGNNMSAINIIDNKIFVEAGCSFKKLSKFALDNNLSGLEYAYGIPGTVGGAIAMNAGAYGGEVKDNIISAKILDENNEIIELSKEDLLLDYRKSIASNRNIIILSAIFELKSANFSDIKKIIDNNTKLRQEKQPLDKPSAGSTFKRPKDNFAGKLIQNSNLSGYSIGGAMVSTKHCGFVVNEKNATANDVINLVEYVIKTVKNDSGVELELEIKII